MAQKKAGPRLSPLSASDKAKMAKTQREKAIREMSARAAKAKTPAERNRIRAREAQLRAGGLPQLRRFEKANAKNRGR